MPANIVECVQLARFVANDQNTFAENIDQSIIAFGLQPFQPTGTKPFTVKYRLSLAREMTRFEVLLTG